MRVRTRANAWERHHRAPIARTVRCLLWATLLLGAANPLAARAEGCGADTGSTCGGAEPDAASSTPADAPAPEAGNPVNVVTGNKYQREVDYRASDSPLEFVRHYNSANADHDVRLGHGWSSSYDTRLMRAGDGYEVVQSNGRRILFRVASDDAQGRPLVRAASPADGFIRALGKGHAWELPDGRTLSFHGRFLIRIDYPGPKFLALRYRGSSLATVTDQGGRRIAIDYTPGRVGLERYERTDFGSSPGRLASVTLPDGGVIGYDYDDRGNLSRVRHPDGTQRRYHYEDDAWRNQLTGITDRTGRRLSRWRYHDDGLAASSEHASGVERVTFDYEPPDDAAGIGTTRVTDALGRQSVYTWRRDAGAGQALLLSGEGPGCTTCPPTGLRYAYTEDHRLESVTDASGMTRRHVHDVAGRRIETWESAPGLPERRILRQAFEGDGAEPILVARPSVNPDGEHVTEIVRGANRLPVSVTERGFVPLGPSDGDGFAPVERTTRLERDDRGRLVAIDGPRDDVEDIVRFRHDDRHRLAGIDRPDGRSIDVLERDADGRATVFRSGTRSPVRLSFDLNGHIASIAQGERTVRYRHDAEGRLLGTTDPDGRVTSLSRDEAARVVGTTDDLGRLTSFTRDDDSRVTGMSFVGVDGGTIRSASYAYDALGRLSRMTRRDDAGAGGAGQTVDFSYDESDRLLSALDLGSGALAEFAHDPSGGSTSLTLSDAARGRATTVLHRDAAGRVAGMTDPRDNLVSLRHDDFGRLAIESSPDRGIVRNAHDAAGNLVRREDANGHVARWVRDAANRPTLRETDGGTTRLAYDPSNGRLAEITNDATRETFAYDAEARLIEHARHLDGNAFVTRYAYDETGRLLRKVLPDGQSLRHHYHRTGPLRGTLRAITRESLLGLRQESLVAEIDVDARDGSSGHLARNGLRTERRFSPDGRPRDIEIDGKLRLEYRFDAAGNIVGIDDDGTAERYAYRDGRLIGADTVAGTFAYGYDATGNRTAAYARTSDGTVRETIHRYPADGDGNRLLSSTGVAGGRVAGEGSDAGSGAGSGNGNGSGSERNVDARVDHRPDADGAPRANARGLTYRYDADARPVRVFERGALLAEYAYNGFGERVKKVVYRGDHKRVTYYLYDGSRLGAEIDAESHEMRHTLRIEDRPVLHLIGRTVYAVHTDQLGTPRIVTDEAGETVWQADYTPFGEALVRVATLRFEHRLPGQYHDAETGTHYNYLRDYDPRTGRYLTPDPIGIAGGPNAYVYASNDPLGQRDVLGLKPSAGHGESDRSSGDGRTYIQVEEYERLRALHDAADAPGYYDYLYELTGHAIFDEFADSLRPYADQEAFSDYSPILSVLRDLGGIGGFSRIEHVQCSPRRTPIYAIPAIDGWVETAFQLAGIQLGASRWLEGTVLDTFNFGRDLIAWTVDLSPFGMLGDILREHVPETDIPAWVPSLREGVEQSSYALSIADAIIGDPTLIWDSITDPIVRDWAEGRYGEVLAGVGAELATMPIGVIKAGKVGAIARAFEAAKRADAVVPGEFGRIARLAVAEARRDDVSLDVLTDAAREAGVLDEFLAGGTLRRAELDELVENGKLTPEEAARAVAAPLPPFRADFDQHVVKVDRDENGAYVITKDGSIKGGHNAREFNEALKDPRGDGVPADIVDRKPLLDAEGRVIGETVEYRLAKLHSNGSNVGKPIRDKDGNIVYKLSKNKTTYFPDEISDSEMINNLREIGKIYYDRNQPDMKASGEKFLHETITVEGIRYHIYLQKSDSGEIFVSNVHLKPNRL